MLVVVVVVLVVVMLVVVLVVVVVVLEHSYYRMTLVRGQPSTMFSGSLEGNKYKQLLPYCMSLPVPARYSMLYCRTYDYRL